MLKQIGMGTLFVTLSSADHYMEHFFRLVFPNEDFQTMPSARCATPGALSLTVSGKVNVALGFRKPTSL